MDEDFGGKSSGSRGAKYREQRIPKIARPEFVVLQEYDIQVEIPKVKTLLSTTSSKIKYQFQGDERVPMQMGKDVIEVALCGMLKETRESLNLCLKKENVDEETRLIFLNQIFIPVSNMIEATGRELFSRSLDFIEKSIAKDIRVEFPISASNVRTFSAPISRAGYTITISAGLTNGLVNICCLSLRNWLPRVKGDIFLEKGNGIVCVNPRGLNPNSFVQFYLGQLYTPWHWFEREDAQSYIAKKLREDKNDIPMNDFYNIILERPPADDEIGYDVMYVDPRYKGTFASRLSHSCNPNCQTETLQFQGKLKIATYTIKRIEPGQDMTFDYHSVTEDIKEYKDANCLCGSEICRTKYLSFAGSSTFDHVMSCRHTLSDRMALLLCSCIGSKEPLEHEQEILNRHGFKKGLLEGAPGWLKRYAAAVLDFIEKEESFLPGELVRLEPRTYSMEIARDEAVGVRLNRIQNLAISINKVRHVMTENKSFDPPLQLASIQQVVDFLWEGPRSVMGKTVGMLREDPNINVEVKERVKQLYTETVLHKTLTWETLDVIRKVFLQVRDEFRSLPPVETKKEGKDKTETYFGIADLLHFFANTKYFFVHSKSHTSLTKTVDRKVFPLDICMSDSIFEKYNGLMWNIDGKKYHGQYVWGQLMYWFKQTIKQPDASLSAERRGIATLPTPESCFRTTKKDRRSLLTFLAQSSETYWSQKHMLFSHGGVGLYGSPLLDVCIQLHLQSQLEAIKFSDAKLKNEAKCLALLAAAKQRKSENETKSSVAEKSTGAARYPTGAAGYSTNLSGNFPAAEHSTGAAGHSTNASEPSIMIETDTPISDQQDYEMTSTTGAGGVEIEPSSGVGSQGGGVIKLETYMTGEAAAAVDPDLTDDDFMSEAKPKRRAPAKSTGSNSKRKKNVGGKDAEISTEKRGKRKSAADSAGDVEIKSENQDVSTENDEALAYLLQFGDQPFEPRKRDRRPTKRAEESLSTMTAAVRSEKYPALEIQPDAGKWLDDLFGWEPLTVKFSLAQKSTATAKPKPAVVLHKTVNRKQVFG